MKFTVLLANMFSNRTVTKPDIAITTRHNSKVNIYSYRTNFVQSKYNFSSTQ